MSIKAYSTHSTHDPSAPGPSGPCDCHGIPAGGLANQVLKKNSANNYDASWQDEAAAVPVNQNNITRVRYIEASQNTQAAFATAINNLPTFVIGETEIFKFQAGIPNEDDPMRTDIYILELTNIGKGTYGRAGTQLSAQHIWIAGIRRFAPDYAENIPTTQTINLGNVGSKDIVTAFNDHTFLGSQDPVQNQSEGYVLVIAIINGNPSKYLFTGEGGRYGVGGDKIAVPEDFGFFSEQVDADYLPTGGYEGNAQDIVNMIPSAGVQLGETPTTAYRGDLGKIAYAHSQAEKITVVTTGGAKNNQEPTTDFIKFTNKVTPTILSGIGIGRDGQEITIWNDTLQSISLLHDSSSAIAARRLHNLGEIDIELPVGAKAVYRFGTSIWTMIGVFGAGFDPTLVGPNTRAVSVTNEGVFQDEEIMEMKDWNLGITSNQSNAQLNTLYPEAKQGFIVVCKNNGREYELEDENQGLWIFRTINIV